MSQCPNRFSAVKLAREGAIAKPKHPLQGGQREEGTLEAPRKCAQAAPLPRGVPCSLSASPNLLWETKDCTGTNTAWVPRALHFPEHAWSILVSQQDCSQYCCYSQLKVLPPPVNLVGADALPFSPLK